jgi:hypothetical protein
MELKYKIRSRKKYFILTVLFKQNIFFNYVLCIHIHTGVFEMRAQILTTSYWLHVELGKNV